MTFFQWAATGSLTWTDGDVLTSSDLNGSIQQTTPPIGAVLAWFKNLTGVPALLPTGWVECGGQTLSDADSPLNGQTIPDLNGGDAFLRGNATSTASPTADVAQATAGTNTTGDHARHGDGTASSEGHNTTLGDHSHTLTGLNYYSVVWIMRVK